MLRLTKRRYLAIMIESEIHPSKKEFADIIWQSVTQIFGEYGASQAGIVLIDLDETGSIAIVRVNLSSLENVRAAIALTMRVKNVKAAMHVLAVSGTIKSLRKHLASQYDF